MARRKKAYLSDGSSDSGASGSEDGDGYDPREDPDVREERELFQNARKKRRVGEGKQAAWEGIFGEEEEDVPERRRSRGGRGGGPSRGSARFTSAPNFVSSNDNAAASASPAAPPGPEQSAEPSAAATNNEPGSDMEIDEEDASDESSNSESKSKARRSPRVREPDSSGDEDGPQATGMGIGAGIGMRSQVAAASGFQQRPSPMSREGSLMHGGIGSSRRHEADIQAENSLHPPDHAHAFPASFGGARATPPAQGRRQQSAFKGRQAASTATPPPQAANIPAEDMRHLHSISNSFGARLLAKQGWIAGKGLGLQEDGKAVPIQANLNISGKQGIGKGVRTEQSKREARERGEKFSSDEEEEKRTARKSKAREKKRGGEQQAGLGEGANWRKNKNVKIKVEHKTYDQLLAEAGQAGQYAGVGPILDARGGELKEVSSLSNLALSSWTPTSDKTRLPELRHNLQLILDVAKGDVLALAKEGKAVKEKREWSIRELERLRKLQSEEDMKITQLKAVQQIVQDIQSKIQHVDRSDEDPFKEVAEGFAVLLTDYRQQYDEYQLDEVVVGAIAQVLKDSFRRWDPLDQPAGDLLRHLRTWQKAYRYSDSEQQQSTTISLFGEVPALSGSGSSASGGLAMTPFEAMLNTLWLPKVRSAINNEWDPQRPLPAVTLVEQWSSVLPRFMRDNILDQLILPKLHKQVRDWSPRHQKAGSPQSLAAVVFPWLPILGPRAEELLEEAKIRLGEVMKKWGVRETIPSEFSLWKEVFSRGKWDTLILLNILPKLAAHLESDFEVNPRAQDLVPLNRALAWSGLMRESTFAQLMEERFFPKWLDTLHFWLIQPNYNASEVASWYHYWKDLLSQYSSSKRRNLDDVEGIEHGLRYGLKLMNDAMALGEDAPRRLPKPDFKPLPVKSSSKKDRHTKLSHRPQPPAADLPEVTFRAIAEQHAADHNLVFVPTGKSHPGTGKPLFKVSKSVDGRGGITVYVGEDAVYAMVQDGVFRAILLDDMVKMAGGG